MAERKPLFLFMSGGRVFPKEMSSTDTLSVGGLSLDGNISMNSHRITSLLDGSIAGDALAYGQSAAYLNGLDLTAAMDMHNNKISNVGDPSAAGDAISKSWLEGYAVSKLTTNFDIGVSSVGPTVSAANLDTLTDGSDAGSLHTHTSSSEAVNLKNVVVVSEAVAAADPVYMSATNDQVAKAQADTIAKSDVIGICRTAQATPGNNTNMVTAGICAGVLSGATAGSFYYLQDSGGIGTGYPTVGNRLIQVGVAFNATDLFVRILDFGQMTP